MRQHGGNLDLFCTLWILPPGAKLASVHKSCSPFLAPCWALQTRATCPARPQVMLESCSGLTLIQRCFVEGSLAGDHCNAQEEDGCPDTVTKLLFNLLSVTGNCSAWRSTGWLLLPLPSAAHDSSWNIPGARLSAPAHLLGQALGGAWSPGALTVLLFCSQCSGISQINTPGSPRFVFIQWDFCQVQLEENMHLHQVQWFVGSC